MGIRLVSSASNVVDPTFISMYASGTIQRNSLVDMNRSGGSSATGFNLLSPSASTSTTTMLFGVSLDYVQGKSDTQVKVIPFMPGQIWEVDCANAASTTQIGIKHQIYNNLLINNTSYDNSGFAGVFLAYNVTSGSTGSGKLIGEFVQAPVLPQNVTITF